MKNRDTVLLQMEHITKQFPGVLALDDVTISLHEGEVLGLLGENGAGKSTLIKILAGDYSLNSGTIYLLGKEQRYSSPADSRKAGIRVIYQELISMETMSVTENIFVHDLPVKGPLKRVDWEKAHEMATDVLARIGVAIDPRTIISNLSVHEKQIIEIAKAIHKDAKILVLDEPTAALGRKDTKSLFKIVNNLRNHGVGIIYISHRMKEIFEITDRVTVLRDGHHIGTVHTRDTHTDELVSMMVGKELETYVSNRKKLIGESVLSFDHVSTESNLQDISFDLHAGEVLGLFGLLGSGRFNVIHTLFGLEKLTDGKIKIHGKEVKILIPSDALAHAIGYIPLDRRHEGLALDLSVRENITMNNIDGLGTSLLIDPVLEKEKADFWITDLNIKTSSSEAVVSTLSGGNQQKIVLAKVLEKDSKIFLMIEPTRGIDVGTKAEIYQIIEDLCSKGCSVLVASSDIPEMITICDRIEVLKEGRIIKTFSTGEINQQVLLATAAGGVV